MTHDPQYQPAIQLREYIEEKIHALDQRLPQRLDLEQRAVMKAEQSMAMKLEGLNELRGAMQDQSGQFVTKDAFNLKLDTVFVRLSAIEVHLANFDGKQAVVSVAIATAISFLMTWWWK